jgi:flagellin-like protein
MKRGQTQKKGLSPVVATVMLIALAIVLAIIIFLWSRGFLAEQIQKNGNQIQSFCNSVRFDAQLIQNSTGDFLQATNLGNVDIYNLQIKKINNGQSEASAFKFIIPAGKTITHEISVNMKKNKKPTTLEIRPVLLGNSGSKNKQYTCEEIKKTIELNNEQ